MLVETDDAVRTSREELGIAAARCGAAAVGPFAGAVAYAEAELAAAFGLRQRLDEAGSRDGAARRAALEEITARCADAERRLDEVAAAFDELRDLERTAPEALADAEAAHRDLTGRLATAEAALTAMRARYADAAAAPVAEAPGEAGARLAFAAENLARAREALDAPAAPGEGPRPGPDSGRPSAVPYLRAAEGAVGQAARLIGAVDRRAVELAEAAGRLPEALAEAETDLAEARGALEGGAPRAGLRGRAARLEAVVREVRRAVEAGRYDPADALRRTEEAHAALDEALARRGGARRARAFLDRSLSAARSSVDAAEDYLATHRGAVAGVARTRLAEARRLLAAASGAGADADPRAALAEARRADALARQARVLAERDVRLRGGPGGPDGPGSAVVGGILPTGPPGAPASFGGGGTRGRLGGGGRS
ncbi:hypothetical protein [Streptomyces somaliensis]|uniref:hypothetical protein n=1 Tax=Streptomyces somaliensis TaxID=78355 RepID=UPI0034E953F6|nr:hypothetical protein [Streptomyces somaliensis]